MLPKSNLNICGYIFIKLSGLKTANGPLGVGVNMAKQILLNLEHLIITFLFSILG